MAATLSKTDILFRQRLLKSCGLYDGKLDSQWGPKTEAAAAAFDTEYLRLQAGYGKADQQSEQNIATLHPKAQDLARRFLAEFRGFQHTVRIISGTRTYAQQDELYKQGRWPRGGKIVTHARGGESNHNFGIAWDVGLFDGGRYLTGDNPGEEAAYEAAGKRGLANGLSASLEWGGNWTGFRDRPHYQVKATVSDIRKSFEAGKAYV